MKILLDHCLPRRLNRLFPSHQVYTAAEQNWDRLQNGKLLAAAASSQFDVMLTIDKKIPREQNLTSLPIAVFILMAPTNRLEDLLPFVGPVESALTTFSPKTLIEIQLPKID
ncbi:MAG TPA: hypothetical protein VFE58_02715 [Tepidisphaeraceae bacterium]|nr:hypothetical protein [Tepidisphaeraceae bacterium]